MHPRIARVRVTGPFRVALNFTDGSQGVVDLAPWIAARGGVFRALQDPSFFSQVSIDREAGTLAWPNGVDLDPDMLYEAANPTPVGADRRSATT